MQPKDPLALAMARINPHLDEWLLEYKPLSYSQCISMLERSIILSRLEVVKYILAVICGFDSELFVWNKHRKSFKIANGYATAHLNSAVFRDFLAQFAKLGTQFRQMYEFSQMEYFRGQTFMAFQNILGNILEEIIHKTVEVREHFTHNKTKTPNEFNISLLALAPFLDSDHNDNIILTIRNLHAIYLEVVQELQFNLPRLYCIQTLTAIYKRLFMPHRRIRSIVYTMFDYCLRPIFISIEYLLSQFVSVSQLSESSEFLFSSYFKTDEDVYYDSYPHNKLDDFWHNFFHFDSQLCQELPLFSNQSLKAITEAIKGSFVLRKNDLKVESLSICSDKFLSEFHSNLKVCFQRYAHSEEQFDIETRYKEEAFEPQVMNSIKELLNLPPLRTYRFKPYIVPIKTICDMRTIIEESLSATFLTISQPIIHNFLDEFRYRHLRLFNYHTDFFLAQNPHHVLEYIYFLFPLIKELHVTKSFDLIETQLTKIHQSANNELGDVLHFFRPNLFMKEELQSFNDHTVQLELFSRFCYFPSFSNDFQQGSTTKIFSKDNCKFYDFWPLTQLFNSKITEIFNQLFQFLLKLRYVQYVIGIDFSLSDNFRHNKISKENYLLRFRILNTVVLMGRQIESRLGELVQRTEERFKQATTFEDYLAQHQRFLEKLTHINEVTGKALFVQNIFSTVCKFCHTQQTSLPNCKSPRKSVYDAFVRFDRISQDDFLGSLQL